MQELLIDNRLLLLFATITSSCNQLVIQTVIKRAHKV